MGRTDMRLPCNENVEPRGPWVAAPYPRLSRFLQRAWALDSLVFNPTNVENGPLLYIVDFSDIENSRCKNWDV